MEAACRPTGVRQLIDDLNTPSNDATVDYVNGSEGKDNATIADCKENTTHMHYPMLIILHKSNYVIFVMF